jgi:hypothetical protein
VTRQIRDGALGTSTASNGAFLGTRWGSSVVNAGGFLHVAGRLWTDEVDQGWSGRSRLPPSSQLACARECATNLLASAGRALGSLEPIERVLKLKLILREGLSEEWRTLVGQGASDLVIDLLGEGRGAHERTVIAVAALPAGIAMEAEAIIRFRAGGFS